MLTSRSSALTVFVDSDPFRGLLLTVLGSWSDFHDYEPWVHLRFGHQHSRFLSILTRFMDYYSPFRGPKQISIVVEPKARLRVGHQHSQFWPILDRFVDYYSLFWGPEGDFHD